MDGFADSQAPVLADKLINLLIRKPTRSIYHPPPLFVQAISEM